MSGIAHVAIIWSLHDSHLENILRMGGNMNDVIETPMKSQGVNYLFERLSRKVSFQKRTKARIEDLTFLPVNEFFGLIWIILFVSYEISVKHEYSPYYGA